MQNYSNRNESVFQDLEAREEDAYKSICGNIFGDEVFCILLKTLVTYMCLSKLAELRLKKDKWCTVKSISYLNIKKTDILHGNNRRSENDRRYYL